VQGAALGSSGLIHLFFFNTGTFARCRFAWASAKRTQFLLSHRLPQRGFASAAEQGLLKKDQAE